MRFLRITLLFLVVFSTAFAAYPFFFRVHSFYYDKQILLAYQIEPLSFIEQQHSFILPRQRSKANRDFSQKPKKQPLSIYNLTSQDELASSVTEETGYYTTDGNTYLTGGARQIVYFNQAAPPWGDTYYGGTDTIGLYGCGPTAMAMVISSLTDQYVTPDQMAAWSREHGYFSYGSGSAHGLIPDSAIAFGLQATPFSNYTYEGIQKELSQGHIIVALMKKGHFTTSGHFIILRGMTADGKILIADPMSLENSLMAWDITILLNELKMGANNGGPLWTIHP